MIIDHLAALRCRRCVDHDFLAFALSSSNASTRDSVHVFVILWMKLSRREPIEPAVERNQPHKAYWQRAKVAKVPRVSMV